ncbi:MAG: type II 3-dehydroquinate dehydratase [Sandaracinaceae bacterium]
MAPARRILVLHGPNLNLLGTREPALYGRSTLSAIDADLAGLAAELGATVDCRQSNHEGELVGWVQEARVGVDGILLNAAGYSHTSVALRDAVAAVRVPCLEVHLTNVYAREAFRRSSLLAPVCVGAIVGLGPGSYRLGLRGLIEYLEASPRAPSDPRPDPEPS